MLNIAKMAENLLITDWILIAVIRAMKTAPIQNFTVFSKSFLSL